MRHDPNREKQKKEIKQRKLKLNENMGKFINFEEMGRNL